MKYLYLCRAYGVSFSVLVLVFFFWGPGAVYDVELLYGNTHVMCDVQTRTSDTVNSFGTAVSVVVSSVHSRCEAVYDVEVWMAYIGLV